MEYSSRHRNPKLMAKRKDDAMKKTILALTSALAAATLLFAASVQTAYAVRGKKTDCDAVMKELNSGKKVKEVAADFKISPRTVSRCVKKAKAPKAAPSAAAAPAAPAAPAPAKAQ